MKKHLLFFSILILGAWSLAFGQSFNVTFQVDMTVQIAKGAFNTASDKIELSGDFNSWGASDMAPVSTGSKIYAVSVSVPAGTAHYKFYFTDNGTTTWEDDQATTSKNREVAITAAATLPVVMFNNETMPSGAKTVVKFIADMRLPFKKGDLDPVHGKVFVAGDFNGWTTSGMPLTGPAQDSTYTVRVDTLKSGVLINYKFLYTNVSNATVWEDDPNKTFWIVDDTTKNIASRWFNNVDPSATLRNGAINFQVDMSVMTSLGLFNLSIDTLKLRAAFNGWGDSDKSKAYMNQDPLNPNNYFIGIGFTLEKVGAPEAYKFRMERKNPTSVLTADAQYERPLSTGAGNRNINYGGIANQFTSPASVYFDDIYPAFLIPGGTNVTANFSVDMTNALDATKVPVTFDPAQDTLYLVCGQGVWGQLMGGTGGWKEDGDRALKLSKTSGNIYSASVKIPSPGFNGFTYTYEFGHKADGILQKEQTGFDNWTRRVRYIPMTGSNKFVQPYTAKVDVYSYAAIKPTTEYELWPLGLSDVKDLNTGIPLKYNLEQNYPNPFNPSTKIKFSLPKDELVNLKIFNILGQEVATLVHEQLKAGSYSYDFNASKLSSGVYFYRIVAGSFNSVKKMLLIK